MDPLKGRSLVVTGAAGGFGARIAEQAAGIGARVVLADVDSDAADAVAARLAEQGAEAFAVPCDVTDAAQTRALATATVERFGQIDCWINNAGVMPLAFFSDHDKAIDAWHRCIDINIKGVLNGMVAAYEPMMAFGRGHIVNLSSIYSNHPVVGAGVYGASKAAVNFLSESLRVEAQGRIKVTTVRPTGVPATGLAAGVVNPEAVVGILGQNAPRYLQVMQGLAGGSLDPAYTDPDQIEYAVLDPDALAAQVLHAINQPWGLLISDLTVRASGDGYIL